MVVVDLPTRSMAAQYIEVCFPAWPARRALAMPLASRWSRGIGIAPLEATAFLLSALAVPALVAAVSLVALSLLLASVLLAPAALAGAVWACCRHDRRVEWRTLLDLRRQRRTQRTW